MARQADLRKISDEELYAELGRRRASARTVLSGGPKPTCECGKCPKCKKREAMRKYRAGKVAVLLLAAVYSCLGHLSTVRAAERDSGVLKIDKDGRAAWVFSRGYLDTHYCVVADGFDEVTVGFSGKGFDLSEGHEGQDVPWACVPDGR